MPTVNGKKYAYTKTGMAAAKKAAKKSGKKVSTTDKYTPVMAKGAKAPKPRKQASKPSRKK
jgi:hypothetical protein